MVRFSEAARAFHKARLVGATASEMITVLVRAWGFLGFAIGTTLHEGVYTVKDYFTLAQAIEVNDFPQVIAGTSVVRHVRFRCADRYIRLTKIKHLQLRLCGCFSTFQEKKRDRAFWCGRCLYSRTVY